MFPYHVEMEEWSPINDTLSIEFGSRFRSRRMIVSVCATQDGFGI